jgi:hypothetical protein
MLLKLARPIHHRNYHEIKAATNAELGERMGEIFGTVSRAYVDEARSRPHWEQTVATAALMFTVTAQHFPNLVVELEAYASAAKVPLAELWALSCEAEASPASHEKCTTVVTNDGMLAAHNEDWDEGSERSLCIVKKILPQASVLELLYYDSPLGGNAISVNSHGYVQAINSLNHRDHRIGIPRNVLARWFSETHDVEQDFSALADLPRASGFNHVLVSPAGEVFDIECSAMRQTLARPGSPYVHTNHYLSHDLVHLDDAEPDDSTFRRYARASQLVRPQMTLTDIEHLTADRSAGSEYSIFNANTIARTIVDRKAGIAKIWLKREKRAGWIDYPLD